MSDYHDSKQLCHSFYHVNKLFNQFYMKNLKEFDLTYTQYLVLVVLWETSPLSLKVLGEKLDLASNTLTPLLKRLEEKGYVSVVKEGRLKTYVPLISEEEYRDQETVRFFERFHRKSVRSLFMTLVKNESLTEADLEELEAIIRKEEKRND